MKSKNWPNSNIRDMMEIERKFLVLETEFKHEITSSYVLIQGYLNTDPDRTVRVRIKDDQAFITVKGKSSANGLSRFEWEREISLAEAQTLLPLCEAYPIEKIRHEIVIDAHTFEVDEFTGKNRGLILAEVELVTEDELFKKPKWLGKEVTGDARYYNSFLSNKPYTQW